MGTLFFLAAIILAIPTYGLSLVVFFVLDSFALNSASIKLKHQLVQAYEVTDSQHVLIKRKGAIDWLFRKYGVDALEKEKYEIGDHFSGTFCFPETGGNVLVSILRDRSTGLASISADPEASRFFEEIPEGATPEERVNAIMRSLERVRKARDA